jgi:lipoate-protein ligase A
MPVFAALDIYRDNIPRSAVMNMGIDEALLDYATAPSIRFYGWQSPALSLGYFGKFADIASYACRRDLVRRWTGGGIVFHGEDLTYSVIIPCSDRAFAESSISIYAAVHTALRDALIANGQRAELAAVAAVSNDRGHEDSAVGDGRYSCFANPVRADVMIDNRKVAGAAQRRTRRGLLQQGSIQGVDFGNGLAIQFANQLSSNCNERDLPQAVHNRAQEIAAQKYGTEDWLRKR